MRKVSRRARRMERHHKLRKQPALNLVSLMDIFTILVFFLLVNSSTSQQLPSNKDLKLPTSVAKKVPAETLIIAVTKKDILVQGRKVASIAESMAAVEENIPSLKEELDFLAGNDLALPVTSSENGTDQAERGKAITIMGDENIPYELVRKILTTCQEANYTRIAFAANQKAKNKS